MSAIIVLSINNKGAITMKKIRLLSLILALCMVVSLFAACGEESYDDEDEDEDEE